MRIRMLRNQEGSHNGVDLRTYLAGKEYLLHGPHPEMLGRNLIGMGAAEALSDVPPAPAPPEPPPPPPPAPEAPPDPERQPLGPEVTKPAPGPEERAALAEAEAFVTVDLRVFGVQFDPAEIAAHKPDGPPPRFTSQRLDEDDGPDAPPADAPSILPSSDGSLLPVSADGPRAIEFDPKILEGIRPAVFSEAYGDVIPSSDAYLPPVGGEPAAEGPPADAATTPEAPAKPAKAPKGSRAPAVEP